MSTQTPYSLTRPDTRQRTSPLTEQAYDSLRDAIANLVLQPGQPLTEVSLADWLGLGRTPVREALLRLREEGLVESVPRKGYFVSTLSAAEAAEIYEMLEGLEGMACKLAAERATPKQLESLEAAVQRLEDALSRSDAAGWAKADEEVHAVILDMAANRLIRRAVESLQVRIRRLQNVTIRLGRDRTQSTRSHRRQLEAIAAHDGRTAREMRQDLWAEVRPEMVALVKSVSGEPPVA